MASGQPRGPCLCPSATRVTSCLPAFFLFFLDPRVGRCMCSKSPTFIIFPLLLSPPQARHPLSDFPSFPPLSPCSRLPPAHSGHSPSTHRHHRRTPAQLQTSYLLSLRSFSRCLLLFGRVKPPKGRPISATSDHRLHHHTVRRPPAALRCSSALSTLSSYSSFFLFFPYCDLASARQRHTSYWPLVTRRSPAPAAGVSPPAVTQLGLLAWLKQLSGKVKT